MSCVGNTALTHRAIILARLKLMFYHCAGFVFMQTETRKVYKTLLDGDDEFTGFELSPG